MNCEDKSRFSKWIMLLVAIMVSGCTATKLQPAQLSSIRTIGILSLLPTELRFTKIGVTVFNNEKKSIPIGETLNEAARGSVEKMLAQSSSKKVFTIRSDTKALSSRYYANSFVMSSSTELIQPELAQLAKANGLDAIIVIAEVFDRDQGRDGVRIFLRAGLNDIRSASIQPDVVLHVVDKSGTDIASDYVQPDGSLAKRANDKPWDYRLDANLDQATQAKMLAEMKASVSESVSAKMVRLGF